VFEDVKTAVERLASLPDDAEEPQVQQPRRRRGVLNITIYGDGSQTRSFQFIDDLVVGLIKMMNSDCVGPINLGNPIELSMTDLAYKVIKLTNSSSDIIYKKLPNDDPKRRKPDISLAKSTLAWNPIIDLETGLKKTINYFKQ